MAFQSVVNEDMAVGIPGEFASCRPRYVYAGIAGEAITFGDPIKIVNGKVMKATGANLADAAAIAVSPHQHVQMALASDAGSLAVKSGDEVGIMVKGEVYVKAPVAVTTYGQAYGTVGKFLKTCAEGEITVVRLG